MIDARKLKELRKASGLTQAEVARLAKEKFGEGSQAGYAKLENGQAANSKYLHYYCEVIGISLSQIDSSLPANNVSNELLSSLLSLNKTSRLQLAQRLIESVVNEDCKDSPP